MGLQETIMKFRKKEVISAFFWKFMKQEVNALLMNILLHRFLKTDTEYVAFIMKSFLSNFIDPMKKLPKSFFFATWAFYWVYTQIQWWLDSRPSNTFVTLKCWYIFEKIVWKPHGYIYQKVFSFFLKNQFSISVLKIENGILSASIH